MSASEGRLVRWPMMGPAVDATTTFEEQRPRLFGVAYRMLGSVADAMGETAQEIRAGEYEDVREMQQALQQKIMQAVIRRQFQGGQ